MTHHLSARTVRPAVVYFWLGAGVVSVSFAAIFIRLADAEPLTVAAWRLALGTLFVAAAALLRARHSFRALRRADVPLLLLSGACLAVHFATWITSLSFTSVASSVLLVTTTPVFVALASHFALRDRVDRLTALAVALSLAGGAVLALGAWDGGGRHLLGDALALAGAVAIAGYLLVGRRIRGRIDNLPYVTAVYGIAAGFLIAAAAGSGAAMLGLPWETYFWIALSALLPQAVGHSLLNWALAHTSATNVTLAVRAEPVLATLAAIPILGEVPPWTALPGGLLLLAGVYLAVRSEARRSVSR
ncbi:MAG: DMT family transporter [Dehalococcoidia bacterium]